jgi:K+-sensing histidine kinase KdpD
MSSRQFHPLHYVAGLALVALVAGFGLLTRGVIAPTNLVMLFLLVVVLAALRWGLGPAIFTAVVSVLAFDFFIVPPHLTLAVSDTQYLLTFLGLLITGSRSAAWWHAPASAPKRLWSERNCSNRPARPRCCVPPRSCRARS